MAGMREHIDGTSETRRGLVATEPRSPAYERSVEAVLRLQRSAGNRAVGSALTVQRDGPTSLGMRPHTQGPLDPAATQEVLADVEARRPQLTVDVYTRGMNPVLYASMAGRSATDHSPVADPERTTVRHRPVATSADDAGDDGDTPHFEVHPQIQGARAGSASLNQAATGPGAKATQHGAPGTQTSAGSQYAVGVVLQFHDDAHWGFEFTPWQVQLNVDDSGRLTGAQANVQLAIVSATIDTMLQGDDGESWKAQLQGFVQGSFGQNVDAPDHTGAQQTHPAGSAQLGVQAAMVHGPIQIWVQLTGGEGATTTSGAHPQVVLTPGGGASIGVTVTF